MIYLGIDLGTTFSLSAHVNDHGQPTLFPDYHDANEFRTPSVVHIGEEGCLVGSTVEEILEDEPELSQSRFFKLRLQENQAIYNDHKQRAWWPQSLSAMVLKKLLRDVEAFASEEVGGVLIAVPANFNDTERRATKQAARLAGIANVKLIEEPVAAATFYGYSQKSGEQTLFIYDLGGGTFDATVLQVGGEGLFALATEGSNHLGGKDVDEIIINDILDEYQRQHGFRPNDAASKTQLQRFASDAKLSLAKPGKNKFNKALVIAGHSLEFMLSRERFNQLIDKFVDDTLEVCNRCLQAAGMDWSFIDTVLLTGGSSLLPLVVDKVSRAANRPKDQLVCKQPHQAVCYGAAILAQQQFQGVAGKPLQNICSYDLGIRVMGVSGPEVKVLLSKNTPVPAAAATTFYTNRDQQARLIIEAVQQRKNEQSVEEVSLGFFAFSLPAPPKDYPVEIELAYNLEGLVVVTAKDPATGQQIQQVMDKDSEAMDQALLQQQGWLQTLRVNS